MRSRRVLVVVLPGAVLWAACLDPDGLPAGEDGDASTEASTRETSVDGTATNEASSADGGAIDGNTAADVVVIDPFDAPDGFEANGPDAPATCASSGFQCVTPAPSGWIGPFSLYEGNVASAPTCGSVTQMLAANANIVTVPPAQCPACQCNGVTGASCGPVAVTGKRGDCTGTGNTAQLPLNICRNYSYGTFIDPENFAANAVGFSASQVVGGSCTPVAAKISPTTKPTVTWSMTAVGCTTLVPSTPGCTGTKVCSAIPDAPFNAKLCIGSDGDIPACPGAPYSRRVVYYKGVSDTRACGDCSCLAPAAAQCATTVSTSTDNTCGTNENVGTAPTCLARSPNFYATRATAVLPAQSCTAQGGAATGTVVPANPVTVCCEP